MLWVVEFRRVVPFVRRRMCHLASCACCSLACEKKIALIYGAELITYVSGVNVVLTGLHFFTAIVTNMMF